ncbi:MAG: SDR family oxidoreductase [Desulfosporosinus sp.]
MGFIFSLIKKLISRRKEDFLWRLNSPLDIAHAVAYFASDEANYVTGQTIFVCGGKSLFANIG